MSLEEDIPVDRRSKRQRLARIVADPSAWKVCEGCEAIMNHRAYICPICAAYRFDTDPARIICTAKRLARSAEDTLPNQ